MYVPFQFVMHAYLDNYCKLIKNIGYVGFNFLSCHALEVACSEIILPNIKGVQSSREVVL